MSRRRPCLAASAIRPAASALALGKAAAPATPDEEPGCSDERNASVDGLERAAYSPFLNNAI